MTPRFVLRAMMWTTVALLLFLLPMDAVAQNCACRDVNNDGVCDGADLPVLDSQWLGGTAYSDPTTTFLVPAGCSYHLDTVPAGGVRVTAKRIVFGGSLTITPVGGPGLLFDAVQDIVFLPGSQITSGGVVNVSTALLANAAIARASIGLRAGTTCTLLGTNLLGIPVTGFGAVGIQCGSDIQIHGSEIVAAGVNIQSMQGQINAGPSAAGPTISLLACDNPAINPNGNNNGVFDDGDLPCSLNFGGTLTQGYKAINGFCTAPNTIRTINNPLVIVGKGNVDLGMPGPGNVLEGRYKVSIISEDGDVDVAHATIANALPGATAPGGAKIVITADPFRVVRFPLFRDTVTAPYNGEIDVTGTCFRSPSAAVLNGSTIGLPEPNGCVEGTPALGTPAEAEQCDLQGNNNGVLDAGDFPCSVTFSGTAKQAIAQANKFCGVGDTTTDGPDVTISKVDTPDPVVAGGELTYTIEVRNIGDISAINVVATDQLPAGTTFTSCTSTQGTCTHSAGTVTATIGTLGPGDVATLTLKIKAPVGAACTTIDNTAHVTATEDVDNTNNSASASTQCVKPDVKISKSDSPDPVAAGAELTYTITVENVSTVPATNVVVKDTLPTGTSFTSCTSTQGTCTLGGTIVTGNLGTMTAGQVVTLTLKIKAPTGAACTTINNTATVTATNDDNTSNNSASASTVCNTPPKPDVKITKVDTPDPVAAGGEITYTITVQNISTVTANDVVVKDTIPTSTTFISCTSGQGTCTNSAGTVTATVGTLTAGQSVSITLKVRAPTGSSCTTINNTATVTATNDSDSTNNSATASTACKKPDVQITKVDTPDPVVAGGPLTYTIAVKNISEVDATNVVMTDVLPDGTSFQSCTATQGSCTNNSGTVTGNAGTLTPGQTVTFTLKVTAPTGYKCGTFDNVAKVTATNDSNSANNSSKATTTCKKPEITVTKVDTPDPVAAGGTVTYTIAVKNIGFVNANNVTVEDDLSSLTSFISCTASQGSCSYNASTHDVNASLGTLTPGQTATLTIKAAAPTGSQCDGSFKNEVKVATDHEHDTSNNYASTYTTCKKPDVSITKTDSPDPVHEGGTITYTITVKNVSYVAASNVVMTDELPDDTDFISCTTPQGSCSYNSTTDVVTANLGTLSAGQSVVITLKVKAPWGWKCDGKVWNTAKVAASNDSNSSNNQATTYTYCKKW